MSTKDESKQKFRPDDDKLNKEIDDALSGVSLDDLYGFDKPQAPADPAGTKGARKGRIISIDPQKDEVFVDFGGKSQGVATFSQFETEPKVGDEVEFTV